MSDNLKLNIQLSKESQKLIWKRIYLFPIAALFIMGIPIVTLPMQNICSFALIGKIFLVWLGIYMLFIIWIRHYAFIYILINYFVYLSFSLAYISSPILMWYYNKSHILHYSSILAAIFYVWYFFNRTSRINYLKIENLLMKSFIIKKRTATFNIYKYFIKNNLGSDILFPITKNKFLAKIIKFLWKDYITIVSYVLCLNIAGFAAFTVILGNLGYGRVNDLIWTMLAYNIAFGLFSMINDYYAVMRIILKQQKELGRKLVNV